jgi:hypothetical protein
MIIISEECPPPHHLIFTTKSEIKCAMRLTLKTRYDVPELRPLQRRSRIAPKYDHVPELRPLRRSRIAPNYDVPELRPTTTFQNCAQLRRSRTAPNYNDVPELRPLIYKQHNYSVPLYSHFCTPGFEIQSPAHCERREKLSLPEIDPRFVGHVLQ